MGNRRLSGMKTPCVLKNGRKAARSCRRNVMATCPAYSFASAMTGSANGKKRKCITTWQGWHGFIDAEIPVGKALFRGLAFLCAGGLETGGFLV